ncbi:hypothetical protein CL633_04415 [bacterium]|jgi:Holliday junction resolvase RusA-like endonuclease|nr:hypothetical protein [bacterium]|tara:strand:- start:3322 stop:3660 length:339 start_codon:yes stop_codon:yes gene_type:complete
MKNLKITIPITPISINKCWQGKRYKTGDYKQWRIDFSRCCKAIRTNLEDEIEVALSFYLKHYKTTDIDNLIKPTLDALQDKEIIKDDRFIKKIIAEKFKVKNKRDEKIIIEI